jgi:hypothetical protein
MEVSDTVTAMNNTLQKSRIPRPPIESGQVWELADSSLQIGLVGKTLVHYKHYKGKTKRAPISLAGIKTLEKYLKANKAVLVQE